MPQKNSADDEGEPVDTLDECAGEAWELGAAGIDCSVAELQSGLFTDSEFWMELYSSRKYSDVAISDVVDGKRDTAYVIPRNGLQGKVVRPSVHTTILSFSQRPARAKCWRHNFNIGLVIHTLTAKHVGEKMSVAVNDDGTVTARVIASTPGVPYGKSFETEAIYTLTPISDESAGLAVTGGLRWLKKCSFKDTISKKVKTAMAKNMGGVIAAAKEKWGTVERGTCTLPRYIFTATTACKTHAILCIYSSLPTNILSCSHFTFCAPTRQLTNMFAQY